MKQSNKRGSMVSIIAGVLTLMLIFSACENSKPSTKTKSLYDHGLEIIQLMLEMTRSEEYIDIYTGSGEIKSIVQGISAGDFTTPKAVYAISVPEQSLADMEELRFLSNASEELKSFLSQRFLSAFITQVNAMGGAENLAAISLCTVGKTFVNEDVDKSIIYLYTYENAVPAAVIFAAGEDHTVSASGVFINYEPFPCDSAEEIQAFFSDTAIDVTVDVTEVLPED